MQLCLTLGTSEYHTTYLQRFERWMDRMSMYHEFGITHRPSAYSLWFIDDLSAVLQGQLFGNRQKLTRFQSHSRAATQEPPLYLMTAMLGIWVSYSIYMHRRPFA
jgi:hypothetical protein